jgi:hypothetical protein
MRGRPAVLQSPQATSAPQSNKMQEKKTNLNAEQKTGPAKDSADPGQTRPQTK